MNPIFRSIMESKKFLYFSQILKEYQSKESLEGVSNKDLFNLLIKQTYLFRK